MDVYCEYTVKNGDYFVFTFTFISLYLHPIPNVNKIDIHCIIL